MHLEMNKLQECVRNETKACEICKGGRSVNRSETISDVCMVSSFSYEIKYAKMSPSPLGNYRKHEYKW